MFKNKKLFITGGTGSIGNAICHYFYQNKCNEIYASTTNLDKVNKNDSFIEIGPKKTLLNFIPRNFSGEKIAVTNYEELESNV